MFDPKASFQKGSSNLAPVSDIRDVKIDSFADIYQKCHKTGKPGLAGLGLCRPYWPASTGVSGHSARFCQNG